MNCVERYFWINPKWTWLRAGLSCMSAACINPKTSIVKSISVRRVHKSNGTMRKNMKYIMRLFNLIITLALATRKWNFNANAVVHRACNLCSLMQTPDWRDEWQFELWIWICVYPMDIHDNAYEVSCAHWQLYCLGVAVFFRHTVPCRSNARK